MKGSVKKGEGKVNHLHIIITDSEREQLDKYCTGYGSLNRLVRALLLRFFSEMKGKKLPEKEEPTLEEKV